MIDDNLNLGSQRTSAARLACAAALLTVTACASPGSPPGGPPRIVPPRLIEVAPETLAVNARPHAVEFTFDEVINQASRGSGAASGTGGGATGLESLVLVSPRNGSVSVDWGRERLSVRPRRGFRANATYTVTVLAGLSDLRNNVRDSAVVAVFSTGAAIAGSEIRGVIFDWVNYRTAPGAVVEALTADSVPYVGIADSTGRFLIPNVPPGTYLLRGAVDVNGNRAIDPREPFDTLSAGATARAGSPVFTRPIAASVLAAELLAPIDSTRPRPRRAAVGSRAPADTTVPAIALYAFVHDTLTPRVGTVTVGDTTTSVRLVFDRALRPDQTFSPAQVRIVGPDSAAVPVTEIIPASIADSLARVAATAAVSAARPRADSAGAARGARPAVTDSTARSALPPTGQPPAPVGLRPRRPAPPLELLVRLGAPLRPNTIYRLTVRDIRSLSGVGGTTDRSFTTPRAPRPAPAAPARPATQPPAGTVPPPGTTPSTQPPGTQPSGTQPPSTQSPAPQRPGTTPPATPPDRVP